MIPVTEFRMFPVASPEPSDRTVMGTVVGDGRRLDLGQFDTTDEARETAAFVLWWRAVDLKDNDLITNVRVHLDTTGMTPGKTLWRMDITGIWTPGKTPVMIRTGSPGEAPLAPPGAPLERILGGPITGSGHDQTSQYIYLAAAVGVGEPVGIKTGPALIISFDHGRRPL